MELDLETAVLHDTCHREGCSLADLKDGDIRMIFTAEAWGTEKTHHGNATLQDYELYVLSEVQSQGRGSGSWLQTPLNFSGPAEREEWQGYRQVITVLRDGPDALYASSEELCDLAWEKIYAEMPRS